MDGGFFEKIKQLLGGGGEAPPPPQPGGNPWDVPLSGTPAVPRANPMAAPAAPRAGQSDIDEQVRRLLLQREIAKGLLPEQTWNR